MMTHWVETCSAQQKQNIVIVINVDVLDCIITFIDIILQYLPAGTEESHETVRTPSVRLRYELATIKSRVTTVALRVNLPYSGHC
jgi:hypothetical protein